MDTAQWPQGIGVVKAMEEGSRPVIERRTKPQKEQALNCPRCNSINTKFCYYNNYSLTQPRYFCKTCRRYWTEGGSLRNVPVGGGSRKKRSSFSSSSSKTLPDLPLPTQNPKIHEGQDLNLTFPNTQDYHNIAKFVQIPKTENNHYHHYHLDPSSSSFTTSSFSELLKSGIPLKGQNSFMQMPLAPDSSTVYSSSAFALQNIKPTLNFTLDGLGSNDYGSFQGNQESGGRILFPFEDLKQVPQTTSFEKNRTHGDSSQYWNGMLGGGSW